MEPEQPTTPVLTRRERHIRVKAARADLRRSLDTLRLLIEPNSNAGGVTIHAQRDMMQLATCIDAMERAETLLRATQAKLCR
jgi:hypothetical protein